LLQLFFGNLVNKQNNFKGYFQLSLQFFIKITYFQLPKRVPIVILFGRSFGQENNIIFSCKIFTTYWLGHLGFSLSFVFHNKQSRRFEKKWNSVVKNFDWIF